MDADLRVAYLIAESLTKGKSVEELTALQILLQTVSSLVAADLACKRSKGSQQTGGSPRQ